MELEPWEGLFCATLVLLVELVPLVVVASVEYCLIHPYISFSILLCGRCTVRPDRWGQGFIIGHVYKVECSKVIDVYQFEGSTKETNQRWSPTIYTGGYCNRDRTIRISSITSQLGKRHQRQKQRTGHRYADKVDETPTPR